MAYDFIHLAPDLVFIKWHRVASSSDARSYLKELNEAIENAEDKIYFISDLRTGHITDAHVLREMGRLTSHPKWGGGVAIVEALSAKVFVRLFGRFVTPEMTDFIFDDLDKARARLNKWKPGITENHNWPELFPDF